MLNWYFCHNTINNALNSCFSLKAFWKKGTNTVIVNFVHGQTKIKWQNVDGCGKTNHILEKDSNLSKATIRGL